MFAGTNLLLVPGSVPEHQPMQDPESIALRVAPGSAAHRANELTRAKLVGSLAVGQQPFVGRSRSDETSEPRPVARRQPSPAVAVTLFERGCELDPDERLAAKSLDEGGLEPSVRQHAAPLVLELGERPEPPARDELLLW